jgi:hypothetical protein
MLTSDKLTPLIKDLERVEYNLKMLEECIEFKPDFNDPQQKFMSERFGCLDFAGGRVELDEELAKTLMKDLHSILKVKAKNLQDDIAKKLNRGK